MNLSEKEKKVAKKFILVCILLGIILGIRAAYIGIKKEVKDEGCKTSYVNEAPAQTDKTIK